MPAPRPSLRVASDLPTAVPGVWHADALGAGPQSVLPTGHAALDAQLPGGGWPVGALSEVLQPLAGFHEWQLVLPALVQATARQSGAVVLVAPPCEPFGPALQSQGLRAERVCVVRADSAMAALWAAEQALRCQGVLAVMAWLPQAQPAALRRLQLAAAHQQQLLWVFRSVDASNASMQASQVLQASPALLRLQVQGLALPGDAAVAPGMQVQILKRRGPPLALALHLPGCHPQLAQVLVAQAERRRAAQEAASALVARRQTAAVRGAGAVLARPAQGGRPEGSGHALDRTAIALAR
ncbi:MULTISPECIES: translesion DNA synthesis-associated protein ImuA [unclassified Acidovorax]|uniref:translesion DNA synthesis-associated protein ImuA n=1 Tax=unclassified Acidovorax TaxID=2684926 RepID=UPI0006F4E5CC|nr:MULTISPECIES: translesion DNA synthesis-associated protein ImuA [unclassified Acidovorax]KRB28903.1 hypothetical protein ASD94_08230 [Acidovorax sp. Root70]PUA97119.1 protein ImuA [Acidovorax sp. 107]